MKYIILIIPLVYAFVHDGISISIEPGQKVADVTIKHEGQDVKLLTDADQAAFNITQDKIKNIVEVYSGEKPTDVFNKSPTPWGDLYKSYNWREVKREFKIKDIKLANITKEEINIAIEEYSNNATEYKVIDAFVHKEYEAFNSLHYWTGNVKVSAEVKYTVTESLQLVDSAYTSKVGANYFGSGISAVTYTNVRAKFTLKPEQRAKFYIKGTQVKNVVRITYETRLTGDLAVNYANKHEGHHFWNYDINSVLSASNMTTKELSYEDVEVEYLTDFKYKLVDVSSGMDILYTL